MWIIQHLMLCINKLHIVITISGPGGTVPLTYSWWFVPYLGIIKLQEDQSTELLTSFAIGGGAITQDTDTDGDGLKDYEEIEIPADSYLDRLFNREERA